MVTSKKLRTYRHGNARQDCDNAIPDALPRQRSRQRRRRREALLADAEHGEGEDRDIQRHRFTPARQPCLATSRRHPRTEEQEGEDARLGLLRDADRAERVRRVPLSARALQADWHKRGLGANEEVGGVRTDDAKDQVHGADTAEHVQDAPVVLPEHHANQYPVSTAGGASHARYAHARRARLQLAEVTAMSAVVYRLQSALVSPHRARRQYRYHLHPGCDDLVWCTPEYNARTEAGTCGGYGRRLGSPSRKRTDGSSVHNVNCHNVSHTLSAK